MRKATHLVWPILAGVFGALFFVQLYFTDSSTRAPLVNIYEAESTPGVTASSSGEVSYQQAVGRAAPSVVNIYTRTIVRQPAHPLFSDPLFRRFFSPDQLPQRERMESSLGSGVILSEDGYVVTNNHVVSGADSIVVALHDGREASAEVVGLDPETDLAVLKIDIDNLPNITLADKDFRVGDVVLAIGNPFGIGQTVTMGIISATDRSHLGLSTYEDFIQTDAAINPGNSGGALIDARGNLVGINTAIFSKSGGSMGIGFAIPASLALQVVEDLIEHGRVIRGWIGVEIQELTEQLAQSFGVEVRSGVIIAGIFREGPAHKAGVQPGDILLHINGQAITSGRTLMNRVAQFTPGDRINLEVMRNGDVLELTTVVDERPRTRN
mgnify:CR=1 FL=1|jgi:serine protease DegS